MGYDLILRCGIFAWMRKVGAKRSLREGLKSLPKLYAKLKAVSRYRKSVKLGLREHWEQLWKSCSQRAVDGTAGKGDNYALHKQPEADTADQKCTEGPPRLFASLGS
jgi:hypothetical protein